MSGWPDVEGALRYFLRAHPATHALVGNRVFFAVPRHTNANSWPLITVARVGGARDPSEVPLDRPFIELQVWGELDGNGNAKKDGATAVVNALRSALDDIGNGTALGSEVAGYGVQEAGVAWAPDPDTGRPRYVVTAEVAALSS